MERTRWTDRKFTFDFPEGWMPNIIARLEGTPSRLAAIAGRLSEQKLREKPGDGWSIQEHIGHLLDMEEIHSGRIADFIFQKPVLRAADMTNFKTRRAHHNLRNVSDIISQFEKERQHFIYRLEKLDDATQRFHCLHPRLKVMMRPCDLAFFTAEHDDHHIATILQLINARGNMEISAGA